MLMAKSPSAPTKLRNPQWVRLHQHSPSPSKPRSGLFFIPWNITASPAGTRPTITAAATFTAVTAGRTSMSSAPSAYMERYGTAMGCSSNCSWKWNEGSQ